MGRDDAGVAPSLGLQGALVAVRGANRTKHAHLRRLVRQRARDAGSDWLVEVKEGENPYVDKFEEQQLAKKQRVLKNKMQQVKNLVRRSVAAGMP